LEPALPPLAVRKDDPIPLYFQLAERIREQIAMGVLQPGQRLASARELSEQAGISRMTVRQALDYLERQGHLVVRHGAGTFVAQRKLTFRAVNLLGFTQSMLEQGGEPSSKVLVQSVGAPSPEVADLLGLGLDEQVVRISRLRLLRGEPVLLELVNLPARMCPGLETEDLGGTSLYALLEDRYHLRPQRSRQRLEATVANAFEVELLGVAIATPMLLVEGVTFGPGDVPIETFKAIFRGDRFQFELDSQGETGAEQRIGTTQSLTPMFMARD
jgi:GntR family transcriptional regulator